MGPGRVRRFSFSIALALTFTGCVAAADGPSPTEHHEVTTTTLSPTTTLTVSIAEGIAGFRDCLEEAGVVIDEIEVDGLGRPRVAQAMAVLDFTSRLVLEGLDECGPKLTTGALDLSADPEMRDIVQASLAELAACVREEGVASFPNPVSEFTGSGAPFPLNQIPWTDPALPGAVSLCSRPLAPSSP